METFIITNVTPTIITAENIEGRKLSIKADAVKSEYPLNVNTFLRFDPSLVGKVFSNLKVQIHRPSRFEAQAFALKAAWEKALDDVTRGKNI